MRERSEIGEAERLRERKYLICTNSRSGIPLLSEIFLFSWRNLSIFELNLCEGACVLKAVDEYILSKLATLEPRSQRN